MNPLQDLPETLPKDPMQAALEAQLESQALRKQQLEEELALRLQHSPSRIDWTPLATQLDSLYGGDVAKAAAAQNTNADQYTKRTDEVFDNLVKSEQGKSDLNSKIAESGKQARADRNYDRAMDNDIKSDFDKTVDRFDKERKVIDAAENAFTALEEAFSSGDPERVNAALGTYSTFIAGNKGAQSDSDIARQMQPTIEQSYELLKKKFTGKPAQMDPESYANLMEAVKDTRKNLSRTVSQKVGSLKKVYSAGPRAKGYEAARTFVSDTDKAAQNLSAPKYGSKPKAAPSASTPTATGGLDEAKMKRLEELRALKAAGKLGG